MHSKILISKSDLDSAEIHLLGAGIRQQLDIFITEDLKKICDVLKGIESIWEINAPHADKGINIEDDPTNNENESQSDDET